MQGNGRIGIVGAGLMGAGIAQVAAQAGYEVVLRDTTSAALEKALAAIAASQARFVAKNTMNADDAEAARARISITTDLADLAGARFVVEAVFEQLDVKRQVFAELDAIVETETVLATNTTAIPITQIAAGVSHPERVVGTHFFSPVPVMKLCELVRGFHTSDAVLAQARDYVFVAAFERDRSIGAQLPRLLQRLVIASDGNHPSRAQSPRDLHGQQA